MGGEIDLRPRPKEPAAKINSHPSFFEVWAESEDEEPVCCKSRTESTEWVPNGRIQIQEVFDEIVSRHRHGQVLFHICDL